MATVTLEVPDELRELAEGLAESLRRMPADSLRAYLEDLADDAWCAAQAQEVKARIATGESHWVDWEETEARLDALPDQAVG